jgi:tripeptide aminopeptidase
MDGGVAESTIKILLRSFDTATLAAYADSLKKLAHQIAGDHSGSKIDVQIIKQYRNMAEGLANEPRAIALAVAAHEALGRTPQLTIIRGGTDGSQLTEKGLPTPNLSSGQHNIHSPLEWACLDEMVGVQLVQEWAKESTA